MSELRAIYDHLFRFESGGRNKPYPIHKRLRLPDQWDLHDWLIDQLEFNPRENVLDAGCGSGHLLAKLSREKRVRGLGISVSFREIEFCQAHARANGLEGIDFQVMDFKDLPETARFDKIFAVESLKHSCDLQRDIGRLIAALKPGGLLIIADDYFHHIPADLVPLRELWQAPALVSSGDILQILQSKQITDIEQHDLTPLVRHRQPWILKALALSTAGSLRIVNGRLRRNIKTWLGALLLEAAYLRGNVSYEVFICRKPVNQSSGTSEAH